METVQFSDGPGYQEIKPILGESFISAKAFWDNLFGVQKTETSTLTEDEYIDGVFNRDESEFSFHFDVKDPDVKKSFRLL